MMPTAGPPPVSPAAATSPARMSVLAIASLVLGMLGFCTFGVAGLLGIVLSIVAIIAINRSAGRVRGNGLAVAGGCVSAVDFSSSLPS